LHLLTGLAGTALAGEARAEEPKAMPTIAPPDPHPKTPSFKLPPKSCDSHTHIFGPASRYPFSEKRPYNTADAPLETFRSIWGTDWPHPNVRIMPNDGEIVDLIPLFAPDKAIQQKLLVDNPARLFRFS